MLRKHNVEEVRTTKMGKLSITGNNKEITLLHSNGNVTDHVIKARKKLLGEYKIDLNQLRFMDEPVVSKIKERKVVNYPPKDIHMHEDMIRSIEEILKTLKSKPVSWLSKEEHTNLVTALEKELRDMKAEIKRT